MPGKQFPQIPQISLNYPIPADYVNEFENYYDHVMQAHLLKTTRERASYTGVSSTRIRDLRVVGRKFMGKLRRFKVSRQQKREELINHFE